MDLRIKGRIYELKLVYHLRIKETPEDLRIKDMIQYKVAGAG